MNWWIGNGLADGSGLTLDWPWIDIQSVRDRHQIGNGLALDWHQIGTGLEDCLWIDIGLAKDRLN